MPTFKERYLRELDSWLNDALVFYALTGDDPYHCEKRPGEPYRNLANEKRFALEPLRGVTGLFTFCDTYRVSG